MTKIHSVALLARIGVICQHSGVSGISFGPQCFYSRNMYSTKAFALPSATAPLASTTITRREPGDRDVQIEILFCGVCHSDLHYGRNEWSAMPAIYPAVPGHEIVGRVSQVGPSVAKVKVGDTVGVGCLVDSDLTCPQC